MPIFPDYRLLLTSWTADAPELRAVRHKVFVEEQQVPEELEWDDRDTQCLHLLAIDGTGKGIGTGRLLHEAQTGHIGRMAVLREWRGQGVGAAILDMLLAVAREHGLGEVVLNAQTHALGFYARRGFIAEGGEFQDAGIPHRRMRLRL